MLYGVGNLSVCSLDLDAQSAVRQFNIFKDICVSSFSLSASVNEVLARCFRNGRLQIAASNLNQEDYQLDLSIEISDWSSLQFAYGELSSSQPLRLPTTVSEQIPATGGLTITNADISTANANGASVKVYDDTNQVFLLPGTTTPAAGEFVVDETAGTITLNASQQNALIFYSYDKVYTSVDQLGAGGNQLVRSFSFAGTLSSTLYGIGGTGSSSDGIGIYIPRAEPISIPSLSLAGDRATLDISFRPVITGTDTRPFKLLRLDTATPA